MSPGPGKFEGSGELGEFLYDLDADEETGSVQENGTWFGLFNGVSFEGQQVYAILSEDSQGFVDVEEFPDEEELLQAWREVEDEVSGFYDDGYYEGD